MNRGKIPVAEYEQLAKQFNPVKFNADDWAQLAKDAGMKYIVITSKHHDGFAMFDSKASQVEHRRRHALQAGPDEGTGRGLPKHGIKLGFYYSQAQDWHEAGGARQQLGLRREQRDATDTSKQGRSRR